MDKIISMRKRKVFNQFLSDLKYFIRILRRGIANEIFLNNIQTRLLIGKNFPVNLPESDDAVFTTDWFGVIIKVVWQKYIGNDASHVKNYLEIGSFEGQSTTFAAKLFPNAELTCIDTFGGSHEQGDTDVSNLEAKFKKNIISIKERVKILKGTSQERLSQLSDDIEKYDVIFIDGSHFYRHVLLDTAMCWPLLKVGGYLIWDDYDWTIDIYGSNMGPKLAINHFLKTYRGDYEPVFAFSQVCIKKTRSELRFFPKNK